MKLLECTLIRDCSNKIKGMFSYVTALMLWCLVCFVSVPVGSCNNHVCLLHTCHKLLAEVCEIRLIFRGDLTKFWDFFS